MIQLNEGQSVALSEILAAHARKEAMHVLTGNAGTGKTTLMQAVVKALQEEGRRVAVCAPTHKAVRVIASKLAAAGIEVSFIGTIHSFLGLKIQVDGEKTKLRKSGKSMKNDADTVICDECSMLGEELTRIMREELDRHFVLFLGDPAQLPPVGEHHSPTFDILSRSHLGTIVRQAAGNPIITASQMLRECQDQQRVRWDWAREVTAGEYGIYHVPSSELDDWLHAEFTSDEFKRDNDGVRYLCYTNKQVAAINTKIRRWIWGDTPTPFVEGELAICRQPVMHEGGIAFSTNEEVMVQGIEEHQEVFRFDALPAGARGRELRSWQYEMMMWKVYLGDNSIPAIIPRYDQQYTELMTMLANEAKENSARWYERFQVQERVSRLQHVYALTAHTSQGSTFGRVFMDIPDMRLCGNYDPVDMLKLFYVGVTRPTHAVALVGNVPA
jgi:exodeoxyribonuclease-5